MRLCSRGSDSARKSSSQFLCEFACAENTTARRQVQVYRLPGGAFAFFPNKFHLPDKSCYRTSGSLFAAWWAKGEYGAIWLQFILIGVGSAVTTWGLVKVIANSIPTAPTNYLTKRRGGT